MAIGIDPALLLPSGPGSMDPNGGRLTATQLGVPLWSLANDDEELRLLKARVATLEREKEKKSLRQRIAKLEAEVGA